MLKREDMLNGKNKESEINFIKEKVSNPNFQDDLNLVSQQQYSKYSILKKVAIVAAGVGISTAVMSFLSKKDVSVPDFAESEQDVVTNDEEENLREENAFFSDTEEISDSLSISAHISNEMSFKEAFSAARSELGAGGIFEWNGNVYNTYYKEEWEEIGVSNQQTFADKIYKWQQENKVEEAEVPEPVLIYDVAPIVDSIEDGMTLQDAFSVARSEVGPGGIFQWNGNYYNTYYEEELENMSELELTSFSDSVSNINIDITTIQPSVMQKPENVEPSYPVAVRELLVNKGEFLASDEIDGVRVDLFDYDGQILGKLDFDLDGKYEYVYYPETGEVVNLNNGRVVDINLLLEEGIPSAGFGGGNIVPIEVQIAIIDGHETEITIFSDGHIEANVDLDNNGIHDSLIGIDTQGNWEVLYQDGEVIYTGVLENNITDQGLEVEFDNELVISNDEVLEIDTDHLIDQDVDLYEAVAMQDIQMEMILEDNEINLEEETSLPIIEIENLTNSEVILEIEEENESTVNHTNVDFELEFDIEANIEPDSIQIESQNFAENLEDLNILNNDNLDQNSDFAADSGLESNDFDCDLM